MILYAKSISTIYQFFLHTETIGKLPGWYEFIFNTPSHHRVHHSSDLEYLDKNHGGTLILFDRLFGTYKDETFAPHYGLTKKMDSYNPFYITFSEWINIFKDMKKVKNIRNGWLCLFGSPGWRPEEECQPGASSKIPYPEIKTGHTEIVFVNNKMTALK